MAPTSSNQQDVQPLQSLPPSPTTEEDLSRAHAWSEGHQPDSVGHDKGKRRLEGSYGDGEGNTSDESLQPYDASESAPDDEADTRRVEENLRRWEQAERQRRKAARASGPNATAPTSLMGEVALRASFLWPSRMLPFGNHTALQSQESLDTDVPLTDLNAPSSALSATHSPYPSSPDATRPFSSMPATPTTPQDPFANPPTPGLGPTPFSPLEDTQQATALLSAVTEPRTPDTPRAGLGPPPRLLRVPSSHTRPRPPPPRPLGLPPPRTPPPPLDAPRALSPSAAFQPSGADSERDVKRTRWWDEWLCGCGEGPDRGGDYQAGRTNPFE